MAQLLVPAVATEEGVELNVDTLSTVLTNFIECEAVLPVLFFGQSQCGKSELLGRLMKDGGEREENAFGGKTGGIFVWPKPVVVGGRTLMLLKLSADIFEEDPLQSSLCKKQLLSVLSITSICCVCMGRSIVFRGLDYLQALLGELTARTGLNVGKMVVFATDQQQFEQGFLAKSMVKHSQGPLAQMTEFVYRGAAGCSEQGWTQFRAIVDSELSHSGFLDSHRSVHETLKAQTPTDSLLTLLERLLLAAGLNEEFSCYLEKVNNWATLDMSEEAEKTRAKQENLKKAKEAGGQALFMRYFDTVVLNEIAIQQIHREYVFDAPTVVLTVLGPQGVGKSTMLNEIFRTCAQSKGLKNAFRTGNSDTFVTHGAEILSHPLTLGGHQLMLIDMEGLGGHEVAENAVEDVQDLILTTVLCLASVPCIILRNDLQSFVFIEKTVHRVCSLANRFGFSMERIHLLYQDKELRAESEDAPELLEFVKRLNLQYFGGLQVIKVRNKPNFRASEAMSETFLSDLLSDSQYPKLNYSGSKVTLGNLLDTVRFHVKYSKPFVEVHVDPQHKAQADFFLVSRKAELESIFNVVKSSSEGMHLEVQFNEFVRNGITFFDCDRAMEDVKDYVNAELYTAANAYRLRLAQIENCYRLTRLMSVGDLIDLVKQYLDYLYREAWIISKFLDRSNELKGKLEEMGRRYPAETETLPIVLAAFKEKQENLRNWFIANYTMQAAATVATGGLGVAANGARVAVTAARLGYAAAAGGFALASRFAYGITTTLAMTEKAVRLFTFKKDYPDGAMNKVKSFLKRNSLREIVSLSKDFASRVETLPAGTPLAVMLVIGGKKMMTHSVLNELVQCVSPFTCSHLETFSDSKSSQSLFFAYTRCHRQLRDPAERTPSQGLIVYLRLTAKQDTRKYRVLLKIASGLIVHASTACVFVNDENQHLKGIFDSLHMMARAQMRTLLLPKIAAFAVGKNKAMLYHELRQKLRRCGGIYEVKAINELSPTEVKNTLVGLKSDLDHSSAITKEDFLALLSTLVGQSNSLD